MGFAFNDNFFIDAGLLPSHIGFESAISKDNWNLSRSLLAENSPYYETGIKLNYVPNEKWTIALLGLNGWQHIKDNNSALAFGSQIQYRPNEKWLVNSGTFLGNEKPDSAKQLRFFHNFYASYAIHSKLNMALLFDIGIEEKVSNNGNNKWSGISWLLQYIPDKKFSMALRAEYYKDKAGVIITRASVNGFRLSGFAGNLDFHLRNNIVWRTEARFLHSADKIFIKNGQSKNNNFSLLTSIAAWF